MLPANLFVFTTVSLKLCRANSVLKRNDAPTIKTDNPGKPFKT